MDEIPEEGWYTDPLGRHEARWLSEGEPTNLVHDGGVESHDDVTGPQTETAVRIPAEGEGAREGGDLRRADDAERDDPYDPRRASDAASVAIDESTGL